MKNSAAFLFLLLMNFTATAQFDTDSLTVSGIQFAESDDMIDFNGTELEKENDEILSALKIKKQDLNRVSIDDMESTGLFSQMQIAAFMNYRRLLGPVLEIQELQSVPYWDNDLIHKVRNYYCVNSTDVTLSGLTSDMKQTTCKISLGMSKVLQLSKGYRFDTVNLKVPYTGSPFHYNIRLNGVSPRSLRYSFLAEKDPGERFWNAKSGRLNGFVSAHLSYAGTGMLKMLVLGDYLVNLGMGLVQWQSFVNNKTMSVPDIVRKSSLISSYSGAGEFNFHRGIAVVLQQKVWRLFAWLSLKKIDASLSQDSISHQLSANYILTTGYHRTASELAMFNNLNELHSGARLDVRFKDFKLGINFMRCQFSAKFKAKDRIADLNEFKNNSLNNISFDYQYRIKNHLFFGESAISEKKSFATVNGWLCVLSSKFDIALVHRFFPVNFQTFYANTFSNKIRPINDRGFFMLCNYNINSKNKLSVRFERYAAFLPGYGDISRPYGTEFRIHWDYTPSKLAQLQMSVIEKDETSVDKNNDLQHALNEMRRSIQLKLGSSIDLQKKCKISIGTAVIKNSDKDQGFMLFLSLSGKMLKNKLSLRAQTAFFNTDSYFSRLYVFDSEQNNIIRSIPLYDKGIRYSVSSSLSIFRRYVLAISCAEIIYKNRSCTGTSYDEIPGNRRSVLTIGIYTKN